MTLECFRIAIFGIMKQRNVKIVKFVLKKQFICNKVRSLFCKDNNKRTPLWEGYEF
jgi:hypothetical protein